VAIYVCAIFSFPTVLYSLYIVGPLSKLTDIVLLLKITQIVITHLDHNTVIFQKEKGGWGYIYKSLVCKTPIVKVDRNKMNKKKPEQISSDTFLTIY
jgi:hypothetical protein